MTGALARLHPYHLLALYQKIFKAHMAQRFMTPLLVLYLRILSSICPAKLCETAPGEIECDLFIGCNNELLVPKPQMALQPLRRPICGTAISFPHSAQAFLSS